MNRRLTLAAGLALSTVGLVCGTYFEREAAAVHNDAARIQRTVARSQQRYILRARSLRDRVDTLPDEFERQAVLAQASSDPHVHLRLDLSADRIALVDNGVVLRSIAVAVGANVDLQEDDGPARTLAVRRGVHTLAEKFRRGDFDVPKWWTGPNPDGRQGGEGLYGERTLILGDGTLIYSTPEWGPWTGKDQVRPAAVELPPTDMDAIFGAIAPGSSVYVY